MVFELSIFYGANYRDAFNALLVASEACGLRIRDLQGFRFNVRHASLDLDACMSTLRQRSILSKLSSLSLGFALPVDGNFNNTHFSTRMESGLNQLTQLKSLCLCSFPLSSIHRGDHCRKSFRSACIYHSSLSFDFKGSAFHFAMC